MKKKHTEWKWIFVIYTSDPGLISRIYKELIKQRAKEANDSVEKWAKDRNREFWIEEIKMAEKYFKSIHPNNWENEN